MVCLGNICRSPIADGLLRRKVKENNLNILVDSAGTAAYHIVFEEFLLFFVLPLVKT
jgi:protein-tyrosine phosphatase